MNSSFASAMIMDFVVQVLVSTAAVAFDRAGDNVLGRYSGGHVLFFVRDSDEITPLPPRLKSMISFCFGRDQSVTTSRST